MQYYILNKFKAKKINDKYLITTDHGSWFFLNDKEHALLITNSYEQDTDLLNLLMEKGVVISEKNLFAISEQYKKKYAYLFNGTSLHILAITKRCNHICLYCHSNVKPETSEGYDMDKETAKKCLEFIFQTPAQDIQIEFQGGEPLLNFEIIEYIVEEAKKINEQHKKTVSFNLVTNLTKMDSTILKFFIKNRIGLCTSLDGPEYVHNKNRSLTNGNSYKNTVYWINEIKNNYNYDIKALMVTTRYSLPYYKEIIDEYVKNKLDWVKLRFVDNLGFAKNALKSIGYPPQEYIKFWKNAMEYLVEINMKYFLKEKLTEYILKKFLGIWPNYTDLESPCGAAIAQLAYTENGDVYTCDEARQFELFKLGNAFEHSYKEILSSGQTCSIISASTNDCLLCDNCVWKPFCGVCPVCIYSETGTLLPKLASDTRCEIYKNKFEFILSNYSFDKRYRYMFLDWANNKNQKI